MRFETLDSRAVRLTYFLNCLLLPAPPVLCIADLESLSCLAFGLAAPLAPGLAPALLLAWVWRAFASLAAASWACLRSSGALAFFALMSSRDMPTIAFWNFWTLRVRFFACSSTLPFLFMRRHAWVQRSFTGLMRWWKSCSAFLVMKKFTLPSLAMNFWPWPG